LSNKQTLVVGNISVILNQISYRLLKLCWISYVVNIYYLSYCNRQFGCEPRTCRVCDLIFFVVFFVGVGGLTVRGRCLRSLALEFWGGRSFWKKGGVMSLQSGGTCYGVCVWDPILDPSYCQNSPWGKLLHKVPQGIRWLQAWGRWTQIVSPPYRLV